MFMKFDNALDAFHHLFTMDEHKMLENLDSVVEKEDAIYQEVRQLINAHHSSDDGSAIEELISAQASELVENDIVLNLVGKQVGVYQLKSMIGHGGMGAVYLGERNDGQLEQKVAIKFVFPALAAIAGNGFLQKEAQHLADLEHPNITKILTVGRTDDDLPYMVMEYIDGKSIDKYCEQQNLTLTQRLSLFKKVCSAVQIAHQNMVIHADIKPSNILVDQQGEPKLMDFGIAQNISTAADKNESIDQHTQNYLKALSRDYASPEQKEGKALTFACDVYALAKNLDHLLCGADSSLIFKETKSIIKLFIDDKPSARPSLLQFVAYLDDALNTRKVKPYSTSLIYAIRKFVTRNKAFSVASSVASGLLVAFILNIVTTNEELREKSEIAEQSLEFLEGALLSLEPGDLNHKTVEDMVLARVEDIDDVESAQVRAKLSYSFARIAHNIDKYDVAIKLTKTAQAHYSQRQDYYQLLRAMTTESEVLRKSGKIEEAIAIHKKRLDLAYEHDVQTSIPISHNNLGGIYFSLNDYENAYKHYSEAVKHKDKAEKRADYVGSEAMLYQNLASAAGLLKKVEEAEKYFKLAEETLKKSKDENLGQKAELKSQLGFFYLHQEQYDLASEYLQASLDSTIQLYGAEHLNVAYKSYNLAKTYQGLKKHSESLPLIETAVNIFLKKFGEEDYRLAIVRNGLADCHYLLGNYEVALEIVEKAIPVLDSFFGPEHTRTTDALESKADIEKAIAKKLAEA